jgi:hypothetical protein
LYADFDAVAFGSQFKQSMAGIGSWANAVLLPAAIKFQGLPAPGPEIVPSKEPVVKRVVWLNKRSTVKLPAAPANRR